MEEKRERQALTSEQMAAFMNAAVEACREKGQGVFQCPVCQGTATALRSNYNGHVMAVCSSCGASFRQ